MRLSKTLSTLAIGLAASAFVAVSVPAVAAQLARESLHQIPPPPRTVLTTLANRDHPYPPEPFGLPHVGLVFTKPKYVTTRPSSICELQLSSTLLQISVAA